MRRVMLAGFLAFAYVLPESAGAAELKQETTEAFNQYVCATEDRMAEGLRDGGWTDFQSCSETSCTLSFGREKLSSSGWKLSKKRNAFQERSL